MFDAGQPSDRTNDKKKKHRLNEPLSRRIIRLDERRHCRTGGLQSFRDPASGHGASCSQSRPTAPGPTRHTAGVPSVGDRNRPSRLISMTSSRSPFARARHRVPRRQLAYLRIETFPRRGRQPSLPGTYWHRDITVTFSRDAHRAHVTRTVRRRTNVKKKKKQKKHEKNNLGKRDAAAAAATRARGWFPQTNGRPTRSRFAQKSDGDVLRLLIVAPPSDLRFVPCSSSAGLSRRRVRSPRKPFRVGYDSFCGCLSAADVSRDSELEVREKQK